jgi:hypothetical protein
MIRAIRTLYEIYVDAFKSIGITGKSLLIVLAIKLFIMFAILKIFFFPDFLKSNFDNDHDRSEHVINQIINSK